MPTERKYITGKYEEYYNSFQGQYDSYGKSSSFVTEVNNMVNEFSNISNIMNYWSGEAKTSMEKDTISSIMANLQVTQENAQNALAPCCIAIDSLKACLDDIKLKEDEMLQYENELNDELLPKLEEVKNRLARLNRECSSLKSSLVAEKTDDDKRKNSSINSQISAKEKEISNANDEKKDLEDKIEEINQKITDLTEELNELKDEADTHIQTIEDLESTLKEFSNYVSLTGTIMGVGDSSSFSKYSLEERLNYLQGIIDNYNTIYNSLNDLYQEKYGKGFSFSTEDFKNIDTIFDTFDIYWMAGVDKHNLIIDEGKDFTLFDIDKLTKVIGYFNTCGIMDKIDSYVGGKSWKESGLEQFYYDNSPNFLKINVFNENELKRRLKANYGVEEKDVRSFLKEKTAILKMTETNPGPYGRLLGEYQEYQKLKTTMAVVKEKISNLNNAKKLLPYEMEMENSDFNSYLEKDYSGYLYLDKDKLDIMSQKEIALYDYLLHNKSKSEANAYLSAMENAFNQRIGAKKAAEYIEWLKTDGFDARDLFNSGVEGVKDGVRSFGQGFVNLFKAYSIEEGEKSALDYELMYKSQYMQQLMMDPSFINQTTNDKWLGAADLNAWYNTGSSIGNMAIPALIGMIPGGQGISSVLFGASIAGNAAAEAKQNGASTLQAYVYGGITGLSESITEYTLGKIPGLSKVTEGNLLKNMLGEGFEEFVQEYMDVGVRAAVLGEKVDFGLAAANQRFNTAFEAGKQGAITSGVMNPMSNVVVKGADVAFKGVTNVTGSINLGVDPVTGKNITASTFSEYSAGKNYLKNYNKAQGIVSEVMGKVDANQRLSISDKVKLKNALETVSAQDVAEMTKDFSSDQINALKDATKGLPRVSKNISSKIDLSQTFSEVEASSDLSKVTLDKGSLKEAVTKDGRTLAEYIADEKGAALTSEARSNIESTSRNVLKKIDSRVEQNEKSINKQNTKINDAVDTVNEIADIIENNGEVTFSDKTRLSRAMDTLSTEEVSQVTRNLTKEQVEGLKHAADGVPVVGSKVSSKIETAEKINEINKSGNLSDVSLDSKTLNQKVTRDGSTLAEYIADTKADSLDTNARNNIRSVSEKAMAQIDTRIEENERVLQKQQEVLRRRAKADLMDTSAEVRENPTSAGDIQARNVADQTTSGSETQQSVRAQEQTTTKTEDHVVEAMPTMVEQAMQQQMMQEVLQEEVQEENTRDSRVRDAGSIGLGLAGMLGANSGLQVESTTDSSSSERANSQIGVEERQHDSRTTTFEEERNSTETQTQTQTRAREDIQSFDSDTKTETRDEVFESVERDEKVESKVETESEEQLLTNEEAKIVQETEIVEEDTALPSDIEEKQTDEMRVLTEADLTTEINNTSEAKTSENVALFKDAVGKLTDESIATDDVENIRKTVKNIKFTEEEITSLSVDEIAYFLEYSNPNNNGYLFGNILSENDAFRGKVIEAIKFNPNISLEPGYEYSLSTELRPEEIVENYEYLKDKIAIYKSILDYDIEIPSVMTKDILNKYHYITKSDSSTNLITIDSAVSKQALTHIEQMIKYDIDKKYIVGIQLENGENILKFFENSDVDVAFHIVYNNKSTTISKNSVKEFYSLREEIHNLAKVDSSITIQDRIDLVNQIIEKANSNYLLNLAESSFIKDCIASTLKDLIEKHGTELFQDKSVRNKLFNIYEYSVRNNLDYNYRTVILYRSPINEIIQNYSTVKYDIDSYLKTKILNSNYFVSPEIISDLIVKENNRIELSTYDSNSDETNFLDLNSNGRQRVIDILKNNPSVTYTMSKTDLRRFGLTNLDINNLNVSFAGETITYSRFKDSNQIILNIKRRINSLKNNGSYSIAEKIEDLNDILKIKNDSTSLVSQLDFVATQTDIAIIVESIFESFNENDLFNLSESDIKTLSEFKYHLGNYISQHVESWIEKGLSSNLFDLLKNNPSIDLSSTAYKKLADVLNIHELLDNYDVIKRNSVFKDALIDSLLVKTDLENVLSLNDTQLINLIECSNWKAGEINIKQFELRDNIYDFISNGISSNQTFAERIFNSIENGDISLNWNFELLQKTIFNYDGEISKTVLDKLTSSPRSMWYATDLNEIGKKRFVELFNSSKTKAKRVIVNNFQDNIEILNNIKDGNYIVFIQNKSKDFDIKDVKNSIEALQKMDAKIKLLQNDNSLNVYQDIINDINNFKNNLDDSVDFSDLLNILNDKKYSNYIDLMSEENKKIAWNLNIQKDHILDLALNGREENLVSFILSEDALLPENREIINKLRNNAKIGEGEIAGIDASKVRYTTQINPELLTDKAIARINEFIKNNPDITIALDFKNTSGLSSSMIAKFDSNVLFKIEGAYSNEFIRLSGSSTYVGSEFTSNILNRGELYAVMSKIEEIESRINPSWSEKEKAIYLYEVLKKSITYDHATCDLEDIIEKKDKNNRILGHYSYASDAIRSLRGLVSGKSVCAGYSVIYQELLNRQGIEAYYENGDAIRSDGSRGGHAWNVVVLDGKNYVCDLTWDAGSNSINYQFTQTLEEFSKKHDRTTIYTLVPNSIYEKISTMSNEEVVETINKINSSKRTINPLKEKFKSLFRKTNTSISDDVLTTKDKYSVDKFETEQTINDVSTNNATKSSIDSIIDTELTRENQIAELLESETLIEKANHYADNEIVSEKKEEQKPILLDPPAFTMEDNKLWENYDKEKFDKTFKSVEKDGVTYYIADGEQFKFLVHVIPTNGVVKVQKLEQLQRNLATHPELFVLSDVDSGNYISCSTISSESMPTFGSALSRLTNNGSIILGFNEDDINKIYEYYDHDAGTTPGVKFNTYNETVFKLGQEKTTTEYDEVIISRDGRMPDYIISPFSPDDIRRNANNIKWAKAYGIPIVYINTQTYVNQYATEVHDIIKRLENGECLGQNEYNKLLSLSANAEEIGHLSSTYNTLFGDSSIDNNLPLLFTNAELTNLSKNFNKENIAKVFEIKNGKFILEKAISTSFSNNQSSIVYDAIIEHFELNQKYPYLSRDDFARLIKDICITPRNANDPLSFESILDSLERNKMDIQKVSEILRNIENGIIINRNDVALLEENRYFKVLNDGDMKALFNKELEKVLQNPTKSNVENLYTINYYGAAESTIYDLYIRNSLSGNSSSSVFDILILKYNLEERYPNLTKNEIINKLIEFASISRDNYSTTFGFELSKLDEYAHSISNSSTDATVLQGSVDTSSSNIEDSSEIIADDAVFESIETFGDVDAEVSQLKDISLVIDEICKKNGCTQERAFEVIEKVINTGVYSYVTRDGGARAILQQYTTSELREIVNNVKAIENARYIDIQRVENGINALMEKYNLTREQAIKQVKKIVDTGDMNYMTSYKGARNTLSLSSLDQIKNALNKIENNNYRKSHSTYRGIIDIKFEKRNLEKSFEKIGDKNNSSYGVDQGLFRKMFNIYDSITGQRIDYRDAIEIKNKARENHEVLPKFRKQCSNEYFDFREKVAAKYGISEKDASIIMESIDDKGACSYASVCNEIFSAFLNHEVEFERLFGFPMYKKTNGIISFNSEELLFDIYLNANTDVNGGRFFIRDRNGYRININAFSSKVDPLGRSLLDSKEQQYLSTTKGKNTILINNYLKTKGLYFDSAVLKARNAIITDSQMNGLIKHVAEGINSGKTYSLGIYSRGNEINFYAPRGANYGSMSTTKWHEGGGHSVFVVGVNEEGFTVSSWGKKYLITFNDLMNGGSWLITEDSISPAANQNNRNNQNSYPVMDSKNKRKIAFNDSEIVDDFSVVDDIDNAPSQFNLDSKTEILKIDEKSIIDKMKEKKLPKKDVIKFQSLLKNAKEIVARDNFKHYNKNLSKTEIISSFAKEFGDAGKKVNLLLQEGKSLSEIRQIMINDGEDVSEFDEFVNETISGRFLSTLNSRQLSALRQFTGAGLHKINNTIRNLRENSSYMFVVDDIYESLSNAPSLGCDLLVYRGTDISALTSDKIINQLLKGVNMSDNNELYIALKNVVGLSIRDLGFLSTSPGYKTSFAPRENKNIVFEIIVPDGTKGAYINQLSEFYNEENEYLLSYGTTLRILNIMYSIEKKIIIQCIVESQLTPSN